MEYQANRRMIREKTERLSRINSVVFLRRKARKRATAPHAHSGGAVMKGT